MAYHGFVDGVGGFVGEYTGRQTGHHLLHTCLVADVQHIVIDQGVDPLQR